MLIKPFRKYVVVCRGTDKKNYRWHLKVEPWYKAWKVVNQNIEVGEVFKGFLILSIEDVTNTPYGAKFDELKLWEKPESKIESSLIVDILEVDYDDDDDLDFWEKPISKDEFDFAVGTSDIGYAVSPAYSQSYRCQICGGVVANDICTDCMFDWDS